MKNRDGSEMKFHDFGNSALDLKKEFQKLLTPDVYRALNDWNPTGSLEFWQDWCRDHEQDIFDFMDSQPRFRCQNPEWQDPLVCGRLAYASLQHCGFAFSLLSSISLLGNPEKKSIRKMAALAGFAYSKMNKDFQIYWWWE